MKIYTLTGPSGTGKSYRAMDICRKYNIDGVTDDGLFIYKGMVIAGESAKRSGTKIGAIKAAIFNDEAKAKKVAHAIRSKRPDSILILGTSDEMADLIIERLEIDKLNKRRLGRKKNAKTVATEDGRPRSSMSHRVVTGDIHRIYIEDITTEDERSEARKQRKNYGKHVIPAPAMELKRSFAGYFLDSLGLFKSKNHPQQTEKTVVRPSYSYFGEYLLSENVITDICEIAAKEIPAMSDVILVAHEPSPENYVLNIAVKTKAGYDIWKGLEEYQKKVNDVVEEMTAFNVSEVNIEVRGIDGRK